MNFRIADAVRDQLELVQCGSSTIAQASAAIAEWAAAGPESKQAIAEILSEYRESGHLPLELAERFAPLVNLATTPGNELTVDLDPARADERILPAAPAPVCAAGDVLRDRYVLQARLGSGGKGAVFKALDRYRGTLPDSQQYVALKILHARGDCSERTIADLRLELHCAQILSHRNIVNVYELDRDGEVVFFTMELLDGELLSSVIERLRPAAMRRSQAWQLIRQLGEGLAHAHERGVVHGDLKPRNIMITRAGEVRILDFGAAHRFGVAKSRGERGEFAPGSGTPAYASCEQLQGRPADPRDDLYALACISYELLTGVHPFGARAANLARDFGLRPVRPAGLTGRQWRALQRGLSWHRAGRSISVRLWMNRLTNASVQEHSVTPLQELTQALEQSRMWWRVAAAFLAVTLTSAAVFAQLHLTPGLVLAHLSPATATATATATEAPPALSATPAVAEHLGDAPAPPSIEKAADFVAAPATASVAKEILPGAAEALAAPRAVSAAISVEHSQVKSDDHFVEVRLHRDQLLKDTSFTWWTEPATAKQNVDFVPEALATQAFPTGFRTTRLYVKLLPQTLRSQPAYFYIAVAQAGRHQAPDTVIRRKIWLPGSSDQLQARR